MIRLNSVSKTYNGTDDILHNLSMEIKDGEYLEIVGKSGAGKSTFLNLLGLLDTDYSGEIWYGSKNTSRCSDYELSMIRNSQVGFIFQAYNLVPRMTAYENIMLPFVYSGQRYDSGRKDAVRHLSEKLEITPLLQKDIRYLSGGEKQRVAIARALSLQPKIVLADEPTGNLDSGNSEIVFSVLKELSDSGTTVILVTHNRYVDVGADRILCLEKGGFV